MLAFQKHDARPKAGHARRQLLLGNYRLSSLISRKALPHLFEREKPRVGIGETLLHFLHLFISEAQRTFILFFDHLDHMRHVSLR